MPQQRTDPISQVAWIAVRNTLDDAIPPFAVLAVQGIGEDGIVEVGLPTRDGQTDVLVNGFATIGVGGNGQATRDLPCTMLYDASGGDPVVGEIWGVEAGSHFLSRYKPGFKAMGANPDEQLGTFTAMEAVLVTMVQILSTDKTDGLYPAQEVVYDVITGAYAVGDACWYKDLNDL